MDACRHLGRHLAPAKLVGEDLGQRAERVRLDARLLKAETGFSCSDTVNRYDGRPFLVEDLVGALNAYVG